MTDKPDENFLARWARRKQQSGEGAKTHHPADQRDLAVDDLAPDPAAAEGTVDARDSVAAPAQPLPSVDDLTADTDITGFLRKGVPEELKRLALRKMWSLDPAIRDFIEIAENQYDWNAVDGVPGFGPLPAGSDMEALLAQATGALPPKTEDLAADEVAQAGPDSTALADDASTAHGSDPRETASATDAEPDVGGAQRAENPVRRSEHLATESPVTGSHGDALGAITHAGENGAAQQSAVVGNPPRRRHGGALPL